MSRAAELKAKIAELQGQLEELAPHERMGARELAREAGEGVSPSTAARFKAGDTADMKLSTVTKFMPFTRVCPLCGADSDPEAWGGASTTPQAEGPLFRHRDSALDKFVEAQDEIGWKDVILAELEAGKVTTCATWFTWPQIQLGYSDKSIKYSITLEDAQAWLGHRILCDRYMAQVFAVMNNIERGQTIEQIMDDELRTKKVLSSLTLFEQALKANGRTDRRNSITQLLDAAFDHKRCQQTLEQLADA